MMTVSNGNAVKLNQELSLLESHAAKGWNQHVALSVSIVRKLIAEIVQSTPKPPRQKVQEALITQAQVIDQDKNVYADALGVYWYTTRSGHTKKFAAIKINTEIAGGRVLLFNYDEANQVAYWPKLKMSNGNAGFWTAEYRLGHSRQEAIANSQHSSHIAA